MPTNVQRTTLSFPLIGAVEVQQFHSLGSGSFGEVFLATELETERAIAVKTMHNNATPPEQHVREICEREAALHLTIPDHPNVLRALDSLSADAVGRYSDFPILAVELVDGETLGDQVLRYGAFGWARACSVLQQLCAAVSHVHASKILHLDITPANIISDVECGVIKLFDFNASCSLDPARSWDVDCYTLGNPVFSAPEKLTGRPGTESDLYSVAVTFFTVATGLLPMSFMALECIRERDIWEESRAVCAGGQRLDLERRPGPTLSEEAVLFFRKALAPDPKDRFPDAASLAREAGAIRSWSSS